MLNLSRVIKPWKEADALSAHINLYGFWTETTFLTKSGDLGMVLSVTGVDYESLDNDEQQYAVKRLESALKSFGEGFHVYQYLFKTNRPEIPFATYDDELIDAAIDQRRQFFESKRDRLYQIELFYVIVLEGARSKTGIMSALLRIPRDPQGEQAHQQISTLQSHVGAAVDEYKSDYPMQLKFDYKFKPNEAPFDIQSIYHDDKFTYIKTNAPEKFSVYEMRDGKPNLINYDLREGTYIIPKVMDNGYVELGKKKMEFTRKG
jgi:hypothetical protein